MPCKSAELSFQTDKTCQMLLKQHMLNIIKTLNIVMHSQTQAYKRLSNSRP